MKTIFAWAVTNRPQRAMGVLARAASESSAGRANGTFSRSIPQASSGASGSASP